MSDNVTETNNTCYKLYVHIKPVIMNMGNGQRAIVQEEDQQIYKRYGLSEEHAKDVLIPFLREYYNNDFEIVKVERDKAREV